MSVLTSRSKRTRTSFAAPVGSTSAFASRIQSGKASRRHATSTFLITDSSDNDNNNTALRRSIPPQPSLQETDDALSEGDVDQEALDELQVLEQLTPRPDRRVLLDPVAIDTTQTALDRFRLRQEQGERVGRASIAGPPQTDNVLTRSAPRRTRQSAPLARNANTETSGSRSLYTARSELSAAPSSSRRPLRSVAINFDPTSPDESREGNTTMARPGQRLRPSLAHPDGRLDVPTIEERCAALVINAKGVLHYYMELYTDGWRPESFDDMLRNWTPFESYKTNQLLAEAQYMHHFIDIEEVTRALKTSGQPRPEGFEEAMKMANCATFVHYIHQLPYESEQYGKRDGHLITIDDVVRAPLRNISELSDARRIFLRWILPFQWQLSDGVLNMLLDMSIQIYIHRLERIVRALRSGDMAEDLARIAISDHLVELMSGDVVRLSLQRVKKQRRLSRAEIDRMVQRYETFANVRQIELQNLQYDFEAMRQSFSFQSMAADLTGYVRDVVREVDAGMHSTTLPRIMERLARESSIFSASDAPEPIAMSSSVVDDGMHDSSSVVAGPSQSTPKADAQASQPFASQYAHWLDGMLEDTHIQATSQANRHAESSQEYATQPDLTETQRFRELDAMLETSPDEASSSGVASSPPQTGQLGSRFSAALNSSGRAQAQLLENMEVSETSDATATLEPRRNRDGPFDSPAKEKASRLGFDSQNRLIRRNKEGNRKNQRLLDGSTAAVRESRFDSDGENEEDVFLENATRGGKKESKKEKGKGKRRAVDSGQHVETETAVQRTPRPKRNLRSNAAAVQPTRFSEAADTDREAYENDVNERQTARRTGSRSAVRQLALKQEFTSPTKARSQNRHDVDIREGSSAPEAIPPAAEFPVKAATTSARVTRSRAAQGVDAGSTGFGRGIPDDHAQTQVRILRTASGRLHEGGAASNDEEEEIEEARNRMEGLNPIFQPERATPDSQFIGDDNEAVTNRRAALDAAIAAQKPRPGTLHFYHPTADCDDEAMRLVDLNDREEENVDAIATRKNGDAIAEILRSKDVVPLKRRIGPFRPENRRSNRPIREEEAPFVDHLPGVEGGEQGEEEEEEAEAEAEEERDELIDESPRNQLSRQRRRRNANNNPPPSRSDPLGQTIHVQPYKRSNLYITGHNMTGRARWTDAETTCLLDSLHELARYKNVSPKFKVYTEILKRHGVNGTESEVLARWNNVQLKDKSRNELIRMKREGVRIPYWKRLLHRNLWNQKPPSTTTMTMGRTRLGDEREIEETEEVPKIVASSQVQTEHDGENGGDEEEEDPIRDGDEVQEGLGQGDSGGDGGDGLAEVVIDTTTTIAEQQGGEEAGLEGRNSSNLLRNSPTE
ncbi:uncharacterized protein MEPE_00839 [Melanopsichium pennsylvanicum]|uniref:Uncharacterized protein n=2 Tax=Melanopsichium pennsylvanicum TaxID=63383 RepID=A0AAJ4XJ95_9BASI|nr:hypothetical protein BN887_01456 [Melanopsichium pennsylvanicum 4]SNX82133.1 uncharacterized protein MEPE_00839 [Melanopsichium pennsylvanicum]